jgi:hypothetical protein
MSENANRSDCKSTAKPRTRRWMAIPPRVPDPWRFHKVHPSPPSVADHNGRSTFVIWFRQGGHWKYRAVETQGVEPLPTQERSMMPELRRRIAAEISKYRQSGVCSDEDLALIIALWQDGVSLRAYARRRGVEPATIGDHIERLRYRCIRFYRWWILKNRRRREACQRARDRRRWRDVRSLP